ncbi:MAG TPA: potassium channel family protein [Acidimicrobiia bacterium]|nr:potassium channel family protein [Acidimicrobiia bacterium]
MTDSSTIGQVGHPRSPADADELARFNQQMALPLVIAAVVPLFLLPGGAYHLLVAGVFIAAWLVFLLDLVVHERRLVHYLSTWLGRFDLFVGAAVGYRAEHATNPGFATVGYGDIVPKTTAGRVDGVMIMVAGIALLGIRAGSRVSFFGFGNRRPTPTPTRDPAATRPTTRSVA